MSKREPAAPSATSYKVGDGLYLVLQPVSSAAPVATPAPVPVHHVAITDVSGSMSGDLPALRALLKNKLASMVSPGDLVSLIWFSGRGQCDVLVEAATIAGVADLSPVHAAIDRWLQPVGLTGFKEPCLKVADVVARAAKTHPGHVANVVFMSDGQDNQWSRAEILAAVDKAASGVASAACIAFGYYADVPLLTAMAERWGGSVVLAKDFASYAPTFEGALRRRPVGAKRVRVYVGHDTVGGFAFALSGGDLLTYGVDSGAVSVPEGLDAVAYLSPVGVGLTATSLAALVTVRGGTLTGSGIDEAVAATYAAVSLYAQRLQPKTVKALLRSLGDVALVDSYAAAYGKQRTAAFVDLARAAAFGHGRFVAGYDPTRVPRPDAFTVLDVLSLLQRDGARFFPDHEAFDYTSITRGRVDTSDQLTVADIATIQAAQDAFTAAPSVETSTVVQRAIERIKATKGAPLTFKADPAPDGYEVSALVFNASRPNVSIRIRKAGTVDVSGRIATLPGAVPAIFPTFVYRTYAIIADGLVNVGKLPVRLSASAWATLAREGVVSGPYSADVTVLDLARLPVINDAMVTNLSARTLLTQAYTLEVVGAAKKVYDHYLKTCFPKVGATLVATYGAAAAEWLKEQGITEGSGFSPRGVQAVATDVRTLREMEVSFAGLSSLPTVEVALGKMSGTAKGKQSAGGVLMEPALKGVAAWLKERGIAKVEDVKGSDAVAFEAWLRERSAALDVERLSMLFESAKAAFVAIVGQAWFSEAADMGDVSSAKDVERRVVARYDGEIDVGGGKVKGTVLLREVDEKV